MKTILATAYAINPYKGSEDGMGWNFICQIARFQKVIAITRENNQVHIEKFIQENPNPIYENMQFLYFDTPYWTRFWKRGGRGAMLYYWMWQKAIVGFIKKQNIEFDITHNVNFHNDWTPSHLWKLGKPFVWGPIGHHPLIPKQYLAPYRKSYQIKDNAAWMIKKLFWNISPALKATVKHADYTFCMNKSVADIISLKKDKYKIMPSVATEDFEYSTYKNPNEFNIISAGRLVPLKGFDLTILSFAKFINKLGDSEKSKCKLTIVGSGPEKEYLKRLAFDNKIEKNIEFIKWIERADLLMLYKKASLFLFPSHEGAGMVVAEALSFGLPIICLDNCGPGEFVNSECGIAIPIQDYNSTVNGIANAIEKIYINPDLLKSMSYAARKHYENHFHWNRRGEQLQTIYQTL